MSAEAKRMQLEVRDRIAYLTLTRPEAANTMDLAFGRELLASAFAIEASRARAVILTGDGKNFCFGGDLKSMVASETNLADYLSELTSLLHAALALLARLDAPLIAAVNGTAAGAGLGLVLHADMAIAGRSAKFAPAYTAVGLTPDGGVSFLLPRAVGVKRAKELLLTNRVLDSQTALDWGLVNQVVEDGELSGTAQALAARFAAGPVGAFGAVKRLMAESDPGFETHLMRESRSMVLRAASDEGREGIQAFLEKRPMRF